VGRGDAVSVREQNRRLRDALRELSIDDLADIIRQRLGDRDNRNVRRLATEILEVKQTEEEQRQFQIVAEPFIAMTTEQLLRLADEVDITASEAKAIISILRERLAEIRRPYEAATAELADRIRELRRGGEKIPAKYSMRKVTR
jgi:uncharacterized membrane protein YccC